MLRSLFGLALALRLLVDMATPLMPGAFRFDPNESVEAMRTHSVRGVHHDVVRPASPARAAETVTVQVDLPARIAPDVRAPRFRPPLVRQTSDRATSTSEDH